MYSYDTYSYMMSNVHLDTIIIAIPIDIQNHLSPYANVYTYILHTYLTTRLYFLT